ncbi:hypothetical protein B9Z19DRAFT_1137177 [Tuber borchii]|uniref:Uncharacterized protein n=1 Tax=Tuber borchii TaxID=42251 RepID=A0A2T6ZAR4_TUBBO|nr:hypothetical protein B9Z19DRAFT_1137177 [Tuber borchii]
MAEPVGITSSDDQVVSRSEFISSPPTGIPETYSSLESNDELLHGRVVIIVFFSFPDYPPLIIKSHHYQRHPSPAYVIIIPEWIPPTTRATAAILASCVLGSFLQMLAILFCRRRHANSKPFAFLPTRPRLITNHQQLWWSQNIKAALNNPQSPIASILPRYYRPKPRAPPSAQQNFPPPARQTHSHTIIPVPPPSRSSSTRILTLSTTTRSRSRERISEHTIMEPQSQEAVTEVSTTIRQSAASSQCDYSSATCASWSERSWVENDDSGGRQFTIGHVSEINDRTKIASFRKFSKA